MALAFDPNRPSSKASTRTKKYITIYREKCSEKNRRGVGKDQMDMVVTNKYKTQANQWDHPEGIHNRKISFLLRLMWV